MNRDDRAAIARAIAVAEDGTTGRIAVRIVPDRSVDAFQRAVHEFERSGLQRHEAANAALVLVAPNARRFAIVGDRALHARVGDEFWNAVVAEAAPYFERGERLQGVLHAVGRIGEALHAHFPVSAAEAPQ